MTHQQVDARSLAFGRLLGDRLRANPSLFRVARANLDPWPAGGDPRVAPALAEWADLLAGPPETVVRTSTGTDERSVRLRQSNPFAGVLTPAERSSILRGFQTP